MARNVVTRDQWERARLQWEGDPLVTYADIGADLGVARQSVRERAGKEGWQRRLDLQAIAEKAHAQADSKFTYLAVDSPEQASLPVAGSSENSAREPSRPTLPNPPAGLPMEHTRAAVEKAAVEQRTDVLTMHRKELVAVRSQMYGAIKNSDIEVAKRAKILAEGMKVLHETERKAWGLDADLPKPGAPGAAVKVTVVRKSGRVPT